MSVIVGEVVAPITTNTSGFSTGIRAVRREGEQFVSGFISGLTQIGSQASGVAGTVGEGFKKVGGVLEGVGGSVQDFGQKLTQYITLPLVGAGVAVFNLGKDFESELSKVTGLVGVAKDQVDAWGKDILEMAPRLGKAPAELAEGLFFVTSAGLRGAEAMDVLESSGKASAAGLGETKTIADLVTSAMNAYGSENLSASKATDILVAAVREGKAEAADLAGSMGQVLPLASEMGVTFDQVAAAQAAMTRTGTGADEAATQLKAIMSGLLKPSKQAEDALNAMGTSSKKLRKQIKEEGLLTTLGDLREKTNKYGEDAMAKVFPNIRGLMGVLDLMGKSAETNVGIFDSVRDSTGMLDEAFKASSETLDFKWNQSLSTLQATAIKFFDYLKAVMLPLLDILNNAISWLGNKFTELSPTMQKVIGVFGGIMAAIGPVVTIVGGLIVGLGGAITAVGGAITAIAGIIGTIGLPALAALTLAIPVLIGWVTSIIAVIGAWVASFIYLWKTNDEFRANVINTWNTVKENALIIFEEIKKIVSKVVSGIKKLWDKHGEDITSVLKTAWDIVLKIIKSGSEQLKNIIKLVSSIINKDWSGAWDAIKKIFLTGVDFAVSLCGKMKTLLSGIFKSLKGVSKTIFKEMVSAILDLIVKLNQKMRENLDKIVNKVKGTSLYKAGKAIMQSLINGLAAMIGPIKNQASSIASAIRNFFPFSPAKEGPLRDLNKINFGGTISESLEKSEGQIKKPTIKLGRIIMDNILSQKRTSFLGAINGNSENININSVSVHGVNDLYSLMQEIKEITRRYTGVRI